MGLVIYHTDDTFHRISCILCRLLCEAGSSNLDACKLCHTGSQDSRIADFLSGQMHGSCPACDIGSGTHGRPLGLSGNPVRYHSAVADRVDIRIICLQRLICQQSSFEHFQTGVL